MTVSDSIFRSLVDAAQRAPSGDNCQPFTYSLKDDAINIYLDHQRSAAYIDVKDTATWIALGATLANISIRATAHNLSATYELPATHRDSEPIAVVQLKANSGAADPLDSAISHRHTNRRPYKNHVVPEAFLLRLNSLATMDPRVQLDIVDDPTKVTALAKIAAQFDRLLFEHDALWFHLQRWLRWSPSQVEETADGLPVGSLEVGWSDRMNLRLLSSHVLHLLSRALGASRLSTRHGEKTYVQSSAIGFLSVNGTTRADFVSGGEAFERVWLDLTSEGLSLQPLSGFVFLDLRRRLDELDGFSNAQKSFLDDCLEQIHAFLPAFKSRTPIMMFRMGQSSPPSDRTRRFSVDRVLR